MGFRGAVAGGILCLVVVALMIAGCGGGSNSDASADSGGANEIEALQPGEPEASKVFLKTKKKIAKFGEEASAKEREAASEVLEENLQAREAGEWAKQCSTLTPTGVKEVTQGAEAQGVKKGSCAEELKGRAEPLSRSKSIRENSMTGPIDALRFKGVSAYALYHGAGGRDYAMSMEKIDGAWKVSSLLEE